jgi:hypothetical protein
MRIRLILLVGALLLLFGAAAPVSHARTACVDDILDEWVHPTKSIASTHPLKCYDLALKEAPQDVLLYTNFETDVRSAKRLAVRSETSTATATPTSSLSAPPPPAQPPSAPTSQPSSPPASSSSPLDELPEQAIAIAPDEPVDESVESTAEFPITIEAPPPIEEVVPIEPAPPTETVVSTAVAAPVIDVLRTLGPDDASSVPVPLIVLTILSGLLAIVGGSLLAARYVQNRRLAEAPPLPPRSTSSRDDDSAY